MYSRLIACAGMAVCVLSPIFATTVAGATPEDSTRIEEETGDRKEIAFGAEGWTFGLIFPVQRIREDFNGDGSILVAFGDSLRLPRLRPGVGMGLRVGHLGHFPAIYVDMTADFTLARVDHSYTWRGQSGTMRNNYA